MNNDFVLAINLELVLHFTDLIDGEPICPTLKYGITVLDDEISDLKSLFSRTGIVVRHWIKSSREQIFLITEEELSLLRLLFNEYNLKNGRIVNDSRLTGISPHSILVFINTVEARYGQ